MHGISADSLREKEESLKVVYPEMFSHPELREGEIYIQDEPAAIAASRMIHYQACGLSSARYGTGQTIRNNGAETIYLPLFANLQEFIIATYWYNGTKPPPPTVQ